LDALNLEERTWWKNSGSILIIGKIWEKKKPLIEKYGHLLRGSITLKINPSFEV